MSFAHSLGVQPRQSVFGEQEFEPVQSAFAVLPTVTPPAFLSPVGQSLSLWKVKHHRTGEDFLLPLAKMKTDPFQANINAKHHGTPVEFVVQPFIDDGFSVVSAEYVFIHDVDSIGSWDYKGCGSKPVGRPR
jgi:hypothetical protein